jgi:hypothetical protein
MEKLSVHLGGAAKSSAHCQERVRLKLGLELRPLCGGIIDPGTVDARREIADTESDDDQPCRRRARAPRALSGVARPCGVFG